MCATGRLHYIKWRFSPWSSNFETSDLRNCWIFLLLRESFLWTTRGMMVGPYDGGSLWEIGFLWLPKHFALYRPKQRANYVKAGHTCVLQGELSLSRTRIAQPHPFCPPYVHPCSLSSVALIILNDFSQTPLMVLRCLNNNLVVIKVIKIL